MKNNVALTLPELMFVVGTRALLASGVGLLLAGKLSDEKRRIIGTTLVLIGAVTTIPAALAVMSSRAHEVRPPRVPDEIEGSE